MNTTAENSVELSVIIPITERYAPVKELFYEYKKGIDATGLTYEIIYVLDGIHADAFLDLTSLQETESLTVITLSKLFGESTALHAAFSNSSGNILLTLPAYQQIETSEIPRLIDALKESDMVLSRRWPRNDSFINRLQTKIFNFLLRLSTDLKIHDAGCSARAFTRDVIEEVYLYGDLHRFFRLLHIARAFELSNWMLHNQRKTHTGEFMRPGYTCADYWTC